MSHSFNRGSSTIFHNNFEYSGNITLAVPNDAVCWNTNPNYSYVDLDIKLLGEFISELIRANHIRELEDKTTEEILGLQSSILVPSVETEAN